MENKETKNYDEWPKNDFDGIERLKYRIKKNHASNESENGSDSLDILINAFKEIAKEIASEPSSDEKEEASLHKTAKDDYENIFKGLDTDGDMNEDEYIHDLKEKHHEMLSRKFDREFLKDYVPKKKNTHLRITIDIQEVDDDEE